MDYASASNEGDTRWTVVSIKLIYSHMARMMISCKTAKSYRFTRYCKEL